jgi:glutamyl-Q tRNA(Asp) synthetase
VLEKPPVFRFAPSPTGRLHLGHALSALLNWQAAQDRGGVFLLRIEDIDGSRLREEHVTAIFEDLRWLGLQWPEPVLRQSTRFAAYDAALDDLKFRHLVYPCFCTRGGIAKAAALTAASALAAAGGEQPVHDPDSAPLYPGTCRDLPPDSAAQRIAAGEPHCWRLDMAHAVAGLSQPLAFDVETMDGDVIPVPAQPLRWGDVVLARKELGASYHLAVVIDDAFQGVTHVVRGQDLEAATDIHRVLQALLHLPVPVYRFHPLVRDDAGIKLAKSRGSRALADLRSEGISPDEVRGMLGLPRA